MLETAVYLDQFLTKHIRHEWVPVYICAGLRRGGWREGDEEGRMERGG